MAAMTLTLGADHIGKVVRLDTLTVVSLPDGVFKQGAILVLFNNTNQNTTIQSAVPNSYRSAVRKPQHFWEVPPYALINIVFVADDTVVYTVGL